MPKLAKLVAQHGGKAAASDEDYEEAALHFHPDWEPWQRKVAVELALIGEYEFTRELLRDLCPGATPQARSQALNRFLRREFPGVEITDWPGGNSQLAWGEHNYHDLLEYAAELALYRRLRTDTHFQILVATRDYLRVKLSGDNLAKIRSYFPDTKGYRLKLAPGLLQATAEFKRPYRRDDPTRRTTMAFLVEDGHMVVHSSGRHLPDYSARCELAITPPDQWALKQLLLRTKLIQDEIRQTNPLTRADINKLFWPAG